MDSEDAIVQAPSLVLDSMLMNMEIQIHAMQATLRALQAQKHTILLTNTPTRATARAQGEELLHATREVLETQGRLYMQSVTMVLNEAAACQEPHVREMAMARVDESRLQLDVIVQAVHGIDRQMDELERRAEESEKWIESLASVKVNEIGRECMVCLGNLELGAQGKAMPCIHVFHSSCIEKWLRIRGSCPVCRYKLP